MKILDILFVVFNLYNFVCLFKLRKRDKKEIKMIKEQKVIECIADELKEKGIWVVCADMDGEVMYRQNLTGPIGLVIGNEGNGVSRLVKEKCDFTTAIPMNGDIDSLNASVAAGVLAFEIVRQRMAK